MPYFLIIQNYGTSCPFRSIDYLREASPKQITEVPGIGPKMAQQIYDYFHPQTSIEETSAS